MCKTFIVETINDCFDTSSNDYKIDFSLGYEWPCFIPKNKLKDLNMSVYPWYAKQIRIDIIGSSFPEFVISILKNVFNGELDESMCYPERIIADE